MGRKGLRREKRDLEITKDIASLRDKNQYMHQRGRGIS